MLKEDLIWQSNMTNNLYDHIGVMAKEYGNEELIQQIKKLDKKKNASE